MNVEKDKIPMKMAWQQFRKEFMKMTNVQLVEASRALIFSSLKRGTITDPPPIPNPLIIPPAKLPLIIKDLFYSNTSTF